MIRDSASIFPDLFLDVYIADDDPVEQARFAEMFVKAGCKKAQSIETADLVVFTGGPDVDPRLYSEDPHHTSQWSEDRDSRDIATYMTCYDQGIPMFGVCRGAQLGWVLSGGKLYQDVDNHCGDHAIWDRTNNTRIARVSSVHHQMCIYDENVADIIADAYVSEHRDSNPVHTSIGKNNRDVEAFFVRDTHFFGVQGHPEYKGYCEYLMWTLRKIHDLIVTSPDIEVVNNNYRIKKDILEQRDNSTKETEKEIA